MTEHKLTQGVAKVQDGAKVVEIESWTTDRAGTMTFYREDAEVLRYLAAALESFDVARPEETEDEDEQDEQGEQPTASSEPEATKKPQIVAGPGATKEQSAFALK